MRYFFKILGFVFTALFLWSAYVQNNDPDAFLWYGIYGLAAVVSLLFAMDRLNFSVAAVLGVLYLIGTIVSWPEKFEGFTIGEGDIVNIERGREACGLLIVALVMFTYMWRERYVKRQLKV
ncbi:transmembrane 220 family protein [Zobellia uliginosa]|uniref:transmembrane 220 family protein n=1 Tax=Zobellia uliginosa TaxID=143224 RepID=UPI0026E2CB15|nr:transmembrane 220 family protein [Zobellia uliginosa]MDO6518953.1 transmembrane 220 family protein [Zobellia uliginosa]